MEYPMLRRAAIEIMIDAYGGDATSNEEEAEGALDYVTTNYADPSALVRVEAELAALSEAEFSAVCSGERIDDNEFRTEEGKTVTISPELSEVLDLLSL